MKKVKDIDNRLAEGWFFAYELWLYIIIVLAASKGVFMCGWMYEMWDMTRDRDQIKGLRKKDEKIAAKAYSSVVQLSIHFFVLCVVFLIVGRYFGYYNFKITDGWKGFLWELGYPTFQFVSHFAIPVPISIYGSYKIKSLLEERKNLIGETDIIQQPPLQSLNPMNKKLEEIDQRLDRGWLFIAYKIWLYLTPLLGLYLYRRLYKSQEDYYRWEYRSSILQWGSWGYALHCIFWLLRQAWFEIIAMKQKDVKIATKAYDSLVWLAKYYLIWVLINLWDFVEYLWLMEAGEIRYAVRELIFLSILLIKFYLIPVGISIYGSRKVKDLLEERQILILEDGDDESS